MTPNRVILIWQHYVRAGPLTPDLLSVTCRGKEGSIHQERTEREQGREWLCSVRSIMTR